MRISNKDPFADIAVEWKDAVAASDETEINKRIVELAKQEEENQKAKKDDQDLQDRKDALKYATEPYRESTKMFKLKMKFIMRVLGDKSKA